MYHLATQLKAVVQYRIDPKNNQKFTVTDEEFAQLPEEIKQMAVFHSHLMSEDLIKLIANNKEIKEKIKLLFSNQYVVPPKNVSPLDFYNIIKLMNNNEISYVLYLCYMIQNYEQLNAGVLNEKAEKEVRKAFEIAGIFKAIGIQPNKVIGLLVQIKEVFGEEISIGNESIGKLFKVLRNKIVHQDYYLDNLEYKINYNDVDTDYINNNKYKF